MIGMALICESVISENDNCNFAHSNADVSSSALIEFVDFHNFSNVESAACIYLKLWMLLNYMCSVFSVQLGSLPSVIGKCCLHTCLTFNIG